MMPVLTIVDDDDEDFKCSESKWKELTWIEYFIDIFIDLLEGRFSIQWQMYMYLGTAKY